MGTRMGAGPRLLIWASVAAIVVILVATAWILLQEPPPLQVRRFPDGKLIRLEAVTMGPKHQFASGRRWQRLLAPLLPPSARRRIGATVCTYGPTEERTVVFWFTWRGYAARSNWSRVAAFDERHGEVEVVDSPEHLPLSTDEWLGAVRVPAFPRRGVRLGLRLYEAEDRTPAAEFDVRNPTPGPYPTWTASRLPARDTDGELAVELIRLETGRLAPEGMRATQWNDHWTAAVFRLRPRDGNAGRWKLVGLTLTDATGNRLNVVGLIEQKRRREELHVLFHGNLPEDETVWKLRAEFVRASGVVPSELWQVRGVSVPKWMRPTLRSVADRKRRLRLDLKLVDAHVRFSQEVVNNVRAAVEPAEKGWRALLVGAIDDRGRKGDIGQGAQDDDLMDPPGSPERRWMISYPDGQVLHRDVWPSVYSDCIIYPQETRKLDLTFALVKRRFFEYVSRPTLRR
jgi:hypothetical protein